MRVWGAEAWERGSWGAGVRGCGGAGVRVQVRVRGGGAGGTCLATRYHLAAGLGHSAESGRQACGAKQSSVDHHRAPPWQPIAAVRRPSPSLRSVQTTATTSTQARWQPAARPTCGPPQPRCSPRLQPIAGNLHAARGTPDPGPAGRVSVQARAGRPPGQAAPNRQKAVTQQQAGHRHRAVPRCPARLPPQPVVTWGVRYRQIHQRSVVVVQHGAGPSAISGGVAIRRGFNTDLRRVLSLR